MIGSVNVNASKFSAQPCVSVNTNIAVLKGIFIYFFHVLYSCGDVFCKIFTAVRVFKVTGCLYSAFFTLERKNTGLFKIIVGV